MIESRINCKHQNRKTKHRKSEYVYSKAALIKSFLSRSPCSCMSRVQICNKTLNLTTQVTIINLIQATAALKKRFFASKLLLNLWKINNKVKNYIK